MLKAIKIKAFRFDIQELGNTCKEPEQYNRKEGCQPRVLGATTIKTGTSLSCKLGFTSYFPELGTLF
ncbi:TPA: hypothetical protein ACHT6V_002396 [Legionella pneumophila]|uniref:hypothetical protein n=1 Tax=Legionella pneumophila TaxID=446 RepID=UPI0002F850E1|nr:hypothetical protein [Legionella pneumophila]HBI2911679.1 hypothetical protein [Legionella pneumophila]HBI2914298.1 hypothetical protein [Legionella pneumophila]HBI2917734.1 hypothetical protein [Legionella pneumophila]HBI2920617.1 hypothetical protein [Legionella pneumophila]HBI2922942.1 hypothetical protein [Legionella pneumophila]